MRLMHKTCSYIFYQNGTCMHLVNSIEHFCFVVVVVKVKLHGGVMAVRHHADTHVIAIDISFVKDRFSEVQHLWPVVTGDTLRRIENDYNINKSQTTACQTKEKATRENLDTDFNVTKSYSSTTILLTPKEINTKPPFMKNNSTSCPQLLNHTIQNGLNCRSMQ